MVDRIDKPHSEGASAKGRVRLWHWCLFCLPMAVFLWSGWRAIDYGNHWDAGHRVLDLTHAVHNHSLLPEEYNYPSMTFWLTVAAVMPEAIAQSDQSSDPKQFEASLSRYISSTTFQIRCRLLFLLVSSLAILWTFLLSLRWRGRPWEALLAASLMAASFEVGYHSRWVAPDAVLMQFGALCLFACVASLGERRRRAWILLAALSAGLAAGTKYTGGIFLLPVLFVAWYEARSILHVARSVAVFGLIFLLTTPGVLFETADFLEDLKFEFYHYAEGHVGFSVAAGWEHFTRNLRYLLVAGPSRQPAVSVLFGLLGLLGILGLWRDSKPMAVVLLIVPLTFVPYISTQSVMFVRNLLPMMTIAALLSARGLGFLLELPGLARARVAIGAGVGVVVLFNLSLALQAAETVHGSDEARLFAGMDRYFREHPQQIIQLSPNVRTGMQAAGYNMPDNVRRGPSEDARFLATFPREIRSPGYWPSNDPDLLRAAIGPLSTNYDYYSTWRAPHLIVIDKQKAYELAKVYPPPSIEYIFPDLVAVKPAPGPSRPKKQ